MRKPKFENLDLGINREYAKKFVENHNAAGYSVHEILKTEENLGKNLMNWQETDIMEYLKSFQSVSPISLNSRMNTLRNFGNFIAKETKKEIKDFNIGDNTFIDCIDTNKLLSLTIDYQQYCHIKNQLAYEYSGKHYNVRDKLIFEFAWQGLSLDEIRMLKESNIEFKQGEYGWDIALLHFDDKTIRIEEPEIVQDIKDVLKEYRYVVHSKDGLTKVMDYKDSEYLLKPIQVGRGKLDTFLSNPSLTLQNIFANQNNPVLCDGIDMPNLSIEDIRRSKIIYLLSEDNAQYVDMNLISVMFDLKVPSALYWLKKISKLKYKRN